MSAQGGIILAGGINTIGTIPPKATTYSSTIFQLKVDAEIAPNGVTAYGLMPHMHELGRKLWVEKLARKSVNNTGLLQSFDELDKVSFSCIWMVIYFYKTETGYVCKRFVCSRLF